MTTTSRARILARRLALTGCAAAIAATTTVVATFDDVAAAGDAVTAVMSGMRPDTLELMDAAAVAAVERVRPMGLSGVGTLLLAQCGTGGDEVARAGVEVAALVSTLACHGDGAEVRLVDGVWDDVVDMAMLASDPRP